MIDDPISWWAFFLAGCVGSVGCAEWANSLIHKKTTTVMTEEMQSTMKNDTVYPNVLITGTYNKEIGKMTDGKLEYHVLSTHTHDDGEDWFIAPHLKKLLIPHYKTHLADIFKTNNKLHVTLKPIHHFNSKLSFYDPKSVEIISKDNYLNSRLKSKRLIGGAVVAFGIGYAIDKYNKWDTLRQHRKFYEHSK